MQCMLIGVYLHILEHEWVITESQGLPTGGGHIAQNDLPGYNIGKLLHVGIVGHFWIKICENCGSLVILRMIGVIDM